MPSNSDVTLGISRPKRRKIEIACELCRVRKSRCDGGRPKCGPCTRRKNVADVCTYVEGPRRDQAFKENKSPAKDFEAGESRAIEVHQPGWNPPHRPRPRSLHSSVDDRSPRSKGSIAAAPTPSDVSPLYRTQISGTPGVPQHSPRTEAEEIEGESDANDHSNSWILRAGLLGASSSASFIRSIYNEVDGSQTPKIDKDGQGLPSTPKPTKHATMKRIQSSNVHKAEYVLPPRKTADRLLDMHWALCTIPWVDRLRVTHWYESLWSGREEDNHDIDEQVYYCILNIIFALSYRQDPSISIEDQEDLSEAYFTRAQKLFSFNLLDISYIGLVQALLLMGQYFQSTNMTRECFQGIGLAILIAQNLGLHLPQTISSIRNQHDREMARRAWHGCIVMDRIASMIYGRPLRISQEVARQAALPAAIDDEYLGDEETEGTQPAGQPAQTSFFLAFCRLHIILGDILSTFYHSRAIFREGRSMQSSISTGKQDIDKIVEIDKALSNWRETLEDHLQITADGPRDPNFRGMAVNLYARFLHIRMLLFRNIFSQASETSQRLDQDQETPFAETVTRHGLVTCVKAAQQILELISSNMDREDGNDVIPPWWHVVTYAYTAVTIIIAAQLFPSVVEQISIYALSTSIRQGFRILEYYEINRKPARRCKAALTALCEKIKLPMQQKHTPNGTLMVPDPNAAGTVDFELPADFVWDFAATSDLWGDNELPWLNTAPFDPDSNFWL